MQYALVSSICKTTRRNMTLAVERDVKQEINLNLEIKFESIRHFGNFPISLSVIQCMYQTRPLIRQFCDSGILKIDAFWYIPSQITAYRKQRQS